MYERGLGVMEDKEKARQAYRRAVEIYQDMCNKEDRRGCNNLGAMYMDGLGVLQDYGKAMEYYQYAC